MIFDPSEVLQVTQRLLSAQTELREAEKAYDDFFAGKRSVTASTPSVPVYGSVEDRLLVVLRQNAERGYTSDDLTQLTRANHNTVRTTLSRLVREGRIEKRGYSQYGAKVTAGMVPDGQNIAPIKEETPV